MVMNKKEQAAFENLTRENQELKLQLIGQNQAMVPKPFVWDYASWASQKQNVVEGWSFNAVFDVHRPCSIYQVWSKGYTHYGDTKIQNSRQGSGILWKTELEAWLAARYKLQKDFDQMIARVNKKIGSLS